MKVSADEARRFLVARQHLSPARSLPGGPDGVLDVFRRLGSVQFDPLSVAGRNHDLVLHARVLDYEPAWTDLLYERRVVFEAYNKGLSLVPAAEFPWFRGTWSAHGRRVVEENAEVIELRISEAVLREVPKLERYQSFLSLAVAAGPLLGLVGTVIGMIITFQAITESGSGDPKLMAAGISQAMIATVLGLGIAVPLLFVNAALKARSRAIVQILDEQSTGLLAERLERMRLKKA